MMADGGDWLDALERPKLRTRVRVGSKSDDTGLKEYEVQRLIVDAVRLSGFGCKHTPNGKVLKGARQQRIQLAAALQKDGCVWGWPDLDLYRPAARGGPETGMIEVKRPGEYLTTDEINCLAWLERMGFKTGTACCVDTAMETLRRWKWL